jgi:hypothetical protein
MNHFLEKTLFSRSAYFNKCLLAGLFVVFTPMASCKKSSFSGDSGTKKEAAASPQPVPGKSPGPNPVPPSPPGSVTKGSFTVWTVPSDPQPRQNYEIHIEVKLPSPVANYPFADLSGSVNGTDSYFREIGPNAKPKESLFPLWPDDQFNFLGSAATVVMTIPGAETLVQDKIHVRSQLLNEEQDIAIVF